MEWTRGNVLGRGSTAAVYTAKSRCSDQVFAVKSAELHSSEFLEREERILSTLNCPHIVAYQGSDITLENGVQWFNVFMEYAPHGTVADCGGCMEEAVVGSYTRQILQGLNYLHSNGIVHCDVKGKNVLVTEQGVKIADLGCARRVEENSSVIAGTPAFMAPEVARGEEQRFPADVWALGCTVLEMITGKPPWHSGGDLAAVVYKIGFSGEVPEIPCYVSEQGRDFLGKCLKREPSERWTVEELLGHGFVKECLEVKILMLDSDTPTCVLERGFWDSMETTQHRSRDCPSPRDRIRRLLSDEPVWELDSDEEWVTVRSNEVHDHMHYLEGLSLSIYKTDIFCDIVSGEENSLVVTFCEPTILVELSRWSIISDDCYVRGRNCDCRSRELLLVCLCLVIVSHEKFDSYKMEIFYHALLFCSLFLSLIPFWMSWTLFIFINYNIIWDNVCGT